MTNMHRCLDSQPLAAISSVQYHSRWYDTLMSTQPPNVFMVSVSRGISINSLQNRSIGRIFRLSAWTSFVYSKWHIKKTQTKAWKRGFLKPSMCLPLRAPWQGGVCHFNSYSRTVRGTGSMGCWWVAAIFLKHPHEESSPPGTQQTLPSHAAVD